MKTLIVSKEVFTEMLLGIIKSGVTFEAREIDKYEIKITFTGGF
jgi:hypothetical protein